MSEKELVRTRKHLDSMISAADYYLFQKNMQTCVLKIWQDNKI